MTVTILHGDCRTVLPTLADCSVQCCVTSPPYYGLRDYGVAGQIGLEPTPAEYVAEMVAVFREVRRVLRDDGTLWLNIGDSYNTPNNRRDASAYVSGGKSRLMEQEPNRKASQRYDATLKPKDLLGIPWLLAFALRADGWYLRSDIIWHKPNPMPESIKDRPTSAHEHVFLLTKGPRYYYDAAAIAEEFADDRQGASGAKSLAYSTGSGRHDTLAQGDKAGLGASPATGYRNARNVWTVASQPFSGTTKTVRRVPVAWDAPDDGKKRIASPDCPVHGGRSGSAATAFCDAHAGDPTHHNGSTGTHRAQARPSGSEPIGQLFEPATAACNSGSPRLACSPSANSHNRQTSRTAPALGTNVPCTPCAQKHNGTERTSEVCVSSAPCGCTPASNTASDAMACNASHQMVFGIGDTQSEPATSSASGPHICTCEYYVERAEKTSHFATMPPDLAERCIKAGTKPGDTVLDPFGGAGTTGLVADRLNRNATLIELNPAYRTLAAERITDDAPLFAGVA